MDGFQLNFQVFGEKALLISWPERIDKEILKDIIWLKNEIEVRLRDTVWECVPAYQSLTVFFHSEQMSHLELEVAIKQIYTYPAKANTPKSWLWKLPVCYDPAFGIDQQEVVNHTQLPLSELIQTHTSTLYTVYFIGFLPGFLYLGGLPKALHVPRKHSVSARIPKGSVAIGGSQTGIYPMESPGGWHVIGKSPITFFDAENDPPCAIHPGDQIQFFSIDYNAFLELEEQVKNRTFTLERSRMWEK
jgi:inhibitor of KinA